MARICIITSGQLGSNPRTVKEADALANAGHEVTVIATKVLASVEPRDQAILAEARWRAHRVDFSRRLHRLADRLLQRLAARLLAATGIGALAGWAHSEMTRRLVRAAEAVEADLYIAHYDAALPAAAAAATRHRARFAFDAEDFHPGDLPDAAANRPALRAIDAIERAHLPRAAHVTAASPGIARAYAETYGIAEPIVVLNTFPLTHAPDAPSDGHPEHPTLYWFSQTIGPDRGLETAVRAIARSRHRPRLCLRGMPASGYADALAALATEHGVADRLELLAPGAPSEMARLAAEHSLGLVSETGHTRNRRIALTNKQFTYLLAGVPCLMSDIEAHRDFAHDAAGAAFLFAVDDPAALAESIDTLLDDPVRLAAARRSAFALGQSRFNWDRERERLLAVVAKSLDVGRKLGEHT